MDKDGPENNRVQRTKQSFVHSALGCMSVEEKGVLEALGLDAYKGAELKTVREGQVSVSSDHTGSSSKVWKSDIRTSLFYLMPM